MKSRVRGLPARNLRLRRLGGGADGRTGCRARRGLPLPRGRRATHSYITLSSDTGILTELVDAGSALAGVELTRLGPEAVAWLAPAGGTLDSPFSKLSSKARYKSSTTTRNLRTLSQGPRRSGSLVAAGHSGRRAGR